MSTRLVRKTRTMTGATWEIRLTIACEADGKTPVDYSINAVGDFGGEGKEFRVMLKYVPLDEARYVFARWSLAVFGESAAAFFNQVARDLNSQVELCGDGE